MVTKLPRPSFQLTTVNMDRADAEAMADFYGRLLGWEVTWRDDGFILMQDPAGGARFCLGEVLTARLN